VNCDRALAILGGLWARQLSARGDELDELVKLGLVVESDPEALGQRHNIDMVTAEYHEFFPRDGDPLSPGGIRAALEDVEKKLKNDWYRARTSNAGLREEEAKRVSLRRALGVMSDQEAGPLVRRTASERALVAPGAVYVACPAVGSGVFAITEKGRRMLGELSIRAARFAGADLKMFLARLDKADAKMLAFSREVQALSSYVGYVRKGKAHVVIGLVKADMPTQQAQSLYSSALAATQTPDVAVTCTRNAAREGGAAQVQYKLHAAYNALLRAGFLPAPIVQGAAKSLLPFTPPDAGVPRFLELFNHLRKAGAGGDELYKFTARLMPAAGSPVELVQRSLRAAQVLSRTPNAVRQRPYALGRASVALASMARDDAAVDGISLRFVEIERALSSAGLCPPLAAEPHALECVGCPGTPPEVIAVVGALCARLSGGGTITNDHLTIAAAFAKRFAY